MNTDLDHGDWHSGPHSFFVTVVFFTLVELAGVILLLRVL
jgi:hypothetical protein